MEACGGGRAFNKSAAQQPATSRPEAAAWERGKRTASRTCAADVRRGFREVEGKIVAVALSIAAERVAASCGSHRHHQQHAAAAY